MIRSRLSAAKKMAADFIVHCTAPLWQSWPGQRPWPLSLQSPCGSSLAKNKRQSARRGVLVFLDDDSEILPMDLAMELLFLEVRMRSSGDVPIGSAGRALELMRVGATGCWVVLKEKGQSALCMKKSGDAAIDAAFNRLAEGKGGEIWVMSQAGEVVARAEVPSQPLTSRKEIVQAAREISEEDSLPFPGFLAERWKDSVDPELAEALMYVWRDQGWPLSAPIDEMGFAGQYGPYVFWTRRGWPLSIRKWSSTAVAMRQFEGLASIGTVPERP